MKIAICSDLHLEFAPLVLENTEGADVLILSGDIAIAADLDPYIDLDIDGLAHMFARTKSQEFHEFFQDCAAKFKHVVYVAGNHEHYHGDFPKTIPHLKAMLSYIPNLYILDKETIYIDGVTFVGSTLWTDMNKSNYLTLLKIEGCMSDFGCVKDSRVLNTKQFPNFKAMGITSREFYEKAESARPNIIWTEHPGMWTPKASVVEHMKCLNYIDFMTGVPDTYVVVGHHTPSYKSCADSYKADFHMNGAYHSELFDFIYDRPQIKLWTHGHTHVPFDYMIGETRIVCNPRGYKGYEDIAETFELKYVEI